MDETDALPKLQEIVDELAATFRRRSPKVCFVPKLRGYALYRMRRKLIEVPQAWLEYPDFRAFRTRAAFLLAVDEAVPPGRLQNVLVYSVSAALAIYLLATSIPQLLGDFGDFGFMRWGLGILLFLGLLRVGLGAYALVEDDRYRARRSEKLWIRVLVVTDDAENLRRVLSEQNMAMETIDKYDALVKKMGLTPVGKP